MKNKKLNIVYLDFDDIKNPYLNAGQARATYEVAIRLIKKGHTVSVVTSKYLGSKDRVEDGIEYKHIGLGSRYIRLNNIFYILTLPFSVIKIKADIIIESFIPPFSTLFSPLFTKIPVIGLPSMFNAIEFSKKYHLPFHWIEAVGIRFYKYIMPYSETDSAKALKLNPNLIYKIIPEGVGEEYFNIKHEKSKHILFLGRYDIAQKGIDLLLNSYSIVANKIKYPLVIAGHGPDEKKIRALVAKLNLAKKVKIVGPSYGKKKFKLMRNALYVVLPSRHEEMSLWALEALAAGLPLICFDLPESNYLNKDVSLKAEPFSVNGYSKLLLKATNPNLLRTMKHQSRKLAKKFSWDNVAQEFSDFFEKVLQAEEVKRKF